jgi:acyl-CoA reductase-like NAD-dependent aldehyde dehydrogenase
VQVILGSVLETEALLAKPWAKVLFTGSVRVGRLVALACANTLTPCILECGGKSATVVDATVPTSKLQSVADRIVFAKFFNAGQACVAPDTLFVHENHMKPLTAALIRSIEAQFGKDPQSGDMARIVNQDSAQRLVEILKEVEESKGSTASKFGSQDTAHEDTKILFGGSEASDVHQRYVPPTIVQNPWLFSRIMKEEIFGPILPICTFSNRDEVIQRIQQLNKATGIPLFLYVFTTSERVFQIFMDRCLSGGAVRNDILIQLANPEQPLGGLGGSGYGRYFGKYSFDSFTHKYPVTYRPLGTTWDFGNMRCHPYIGSKAYLLQDFLFYLPMVPSFLSPSRIFLLVVLAVAIFPLQGIALTTDIVATIKLWLAAKLEHLATALRN